MAEQKFDVAVIGEGITGLTAARHAARRGRRTATFEAMLFGGLIINVNELDGVPPELHGSGTDLASNVMMENSELGVVSNNETVTGIARDGDGYAIVTDNGRYHARSIVIASGARLKRLGIPGEAEFEHRGVSQCADCDGPMLQGSDAVVVGGGDSALQEALVLAGFCKQVHLVHRRTKFRARRDLVDAVAACPNIKPVWNTVIEEILGSDGVTGVRTRDVASGATAGIACSGFFAYVGLEPNIAFVPAAIERDAEGRIVTDAGFATALPGVFAAGAVRAGYSGMVADAIREGEAAAAAADARLNR
jgi:thioredoxin reductase (NADPH)